MANDPLSLIADPFTPTPVSGQRSGEFAAPGPRPLSLIGAGQEADRLADAARRAPATSPDQAARVLRLERRTGLPTEVITRNLDEIERETAAADFDVEKFRADSPLLAQWLAQHPAHLALAQDDLAPLSTIERTFGIARSIVGAPAAGIALFSQGVWGAIQAGAETAGTALDTPRQKLARGADLTPLGAVDAPAFPRLAAFATETQAVAAYIAERLRGPRTATGFVEQAVYSGLESLGQNVPGIVLGTVLGPEALLATAGLTTGGQSYGQARGQGVGVGKALAFGAVQGAIEVATEYIPARVLLGDLAAKAGLIKILAHQVASELPGEEIATALQDLSEWAVLPENTDRPFADYLAERPSAAAATAIAVLVSTGATSVVAHGSARVLEQLGAAAGASTTITRDAASVRSLVEQFTGDGSLATVHLPIETFTQYFQSRNLDAARLAEQLTGDRTAYARAQQTGEDLAVPMGAYLTTIAGSPHGAFFAQEARLAPDAPNLREARALDQDMAAQLVAAAPTEEPSSTAGLVRDAMLAKLTEAGIPPDVARVPAAIYEQIFQTFATRAGLDPVALFEKYGLQITREGLTAATPPAAETHVDDAGATVVEATTVRPEDSPAQRQQRERSHWAELLSAVLRDARTVDPTVDPTVIREQFAARRDRYQAGETDTRESAHHPETLLRAIARAGGLWHEQTGAYKGEIERLKQSNTGRDVWNGVKGVFRKAGLSPDRMVEALRQDPQFHWVSDINVLLDAVDSAVRAPVAADTLPGTADLKQTLGIRLGSRWWAGETRYAQPLSEYVPVGGEAAANAKFLAEHPDSPTLGGPDPDAPIDFMTNPVAAAMQMRRENPNIDRDAQAMRDRATAAGRIKEPADVAALRAGQTVLKQDERGDIRFGTDRQFTIDLFKHADLSTLLHESGHFYLELLGDVVDELSAQPLESLTDSQRRMLSDYGHVLQWLGVDNRAEITTAQHEQWARGFEAYLMEGKAPSAELRSVFARVRAWLVSIYRTARALHVELTPEVRGVFDRLLATDDAIAAAEHAQHLAPLFTDAVADAAGLSQADRIALQATVQAASDRARETLQAKLFAELQRERAEWWKAERSTLRADVARAFQTEPVYRALALLQRGTQPDGSELPLGTEPFKLSKEALVEQFGEGILERLPRPLVYTERTGVPPSVAAELLGFRSATALVEALAHTAPIATAIDAATDEEMTRRHGNLLLDGGLAEAARQAVLESGADLFAAELRALATVVTQQPGGRRVYVQTVATLRAIAERRIADTPIKSLRPAAFAAAARRAGDQALEAASRRDFTAALSAKQRQVLNAELYRAAVAGREVVETAIAGFKPIFGREAALAQRYNLDLVTAARALLSQFKLAPPAQGAAAHVYLEQVRKYDPDLHQDLDAAMEAAAQPARPYQELTLDEFIALRDAIANLFHTARRSRQMVIDGKARDLEEVRAHLEARLQAVGTPTARRGYDRAVTQWEKTKLSLFGFRAALRRVESWADAVDGGDTSGVFKRLLFTPISEAASRYRDAKRATLERYLAIVKAVEPSLTTDEIAAPEIGYTFGGKMELLHAILHSGNPSNLSKLLRGRNWGTESGEGHLDTTRWDAFIRRMWQDGVLTKADYEYVQATWDLLESLKPEAQRVHHDLYGYRFAEITAQPIETPFGTFRGGYFPAIVDPFIDTGAAQRADRAALEQTPSTFYFPNTGRGFSKGRIEAYARPLALDLRVVPAHLDQVLRFVHLQPSVRDAGRLLINRGFRRALDTFDPTVAGELLVPWLQRAAKQNLDTPAQGHGGRAADSFWRVLRRRSGTQVMAGNVLNALQQITGLSIAAIKVPVPALGRAFVRYLRAPRVMAAAIAEKSVFMRTRTTTQTIEVQQHIDDLLLNPSHYEQLRAFGQKHGYILSSLTQNIVDVITWRGGYDHAVTEGATETEAVSRADSAVRLSQGSFSPEDLSAFETGRPMVRAFSMFFSYYNMKANLLGSEFAMTIRDQGLRRGAGRLVYVFTFGHLIESLVGAAIVDALLQRLPGQADDDDAVLGGWLSWFFGIQARAAAAFVPGVGPAATALYNTFATTQRYDDKISMSPAIRAIEDSVRAPKEVYDAIVHDGRKKMAVRDALTAIGLLTGLPAGALARPLGYLADVADEQIEPAGPADVARGLVTGR